MEYPNINYIITSQYFDKTQQYELLLAIPNEEKDKDSDAIIIIPEKNKKDLNGCNLNFTDTGLKFNEKIYNFQDLEISLQENKCFLIISETKEKLWYLPDVVVSFLKMDKIRKDHALTILEKNPYILEIDTKNISGSANQTIKKKEKIILQSEFFCNNSDAIKDSLDTSYFIKNNEKYFMKECYLVKDCNKIYVNVDLKIDGISNKNTTDVLGYIELSN